IVFWDELVNWLTENPDLVYRYFSQFFSITELETIHFPTDKGIRKHAVTWKIHPDELKNAILTTLHGMPIVTPYEVSVGITNFSAVQFDGLVDIDVQLASLFEDETKAEDQLIQAVTELRELQR